MGIHGQSLIWGFLLQDSINWMARPPFQGTHGRPCKSGIMSTETGLGREKEDADNIEM
jgi:hypothetical protein